MHEQVSSIFLNQLNPFAEFGLYKIPVRGVQSRQQELSAVFEHLFEGVLHNLSISRSSAVCLFSRSDDVSGAQALERVEAAFDCWRGPVYKL